MSNEHRVVAAECEQDALGVVPTTSAPPEAPICPVCDAARLVAPGHCPACCPIRLFEVKQQRVIRVTYKRQIWARDAEQAVAVAEQGTAWPQSYDESREGVERGAWTTEDVTATGYARSDGGYTDDDVADGAQGMDR